MFSLSVFLFVLESSTQKNHHWSIAPWVFTSGFIITITRTVTSPLLSYVFKLFSCNLLALKYFPATAGVEHKGFAFYDRSWLLSHDWLGVKALYGCLRQLKHI